MYSLSSCYFREHRISTSSILAEDGNSPINHSISRNLYFLDYETARTIWPSQVWFIKNMQFLCSLNLLFQLKELQRSLLSLLSKYLITFHTKWELPCLVLLQENTILFRNNLFSKLRRSRVKLYIVVGVADHSSVSLDKLFFFVLHVFVLDSVCKDYSVLPSPTVQSLLY